MEFEVLVFVEEGKQENPEKRRWDASPLIGSPSLLRIAN